MRSGGRYEIDEKGERRLVQGPTRPHPEGNTARAADGTRLDRGQKEGPQGLDRSEEEPAAEATPKPAKKRG